MRIEAGSLMAGSKQVDHWTSGTVYECSEIAGSPQVLTVFTVFVLGNLELSSLLRLLDT